MPRHRPPKEIWKELRRQAWERDGKQCIHCHIPVTLEECNIDHIKSGKAADNSLNNLRTLCKRCHVLREDGKHRGMISNALKEGIIPPNWRELVWKD